MAVGENAYDVATLTSAPEFVSMTGILQDWPSANSKLSNALTSAQTISAAKIGPLANTKLLAPVLNPSAIFCAGANYQDHVDNMYRVFNLPKEPDPHDIGLKPWHFIKVRNCLRGSGAVVELPTAQVDWEIELAAVIGRTARRVSIERALDYVAGYTVAIDLSARDLGIRPHLPYQSPFKMDWVGQKSFEGACPLGPWLAPAAQIGDPQALSLKLFVNDVLKQDSNTRQMIFTIAEQISHLSSVITLNPGDLVLTGTPAGTGVERGEFLKAGDKIRASIEKIGELNVTLA